MVLTYRSRPVEVQAVLWTGENEEEVAEFIGDGAKHSFDDGTVYIATFEGVTEASVDDYIIQGTAGEFYPCKPFVFEEKYEIVEERSMDLDPFTMPYEIAGMDLEEGVGC